MIDYLFGATKMNNSCPCCGFHENFVLFRKFPSFLFGKPFSISKCPNCGLGKTDPLPKTNVQYYEINERYDSLFTTKRDLYLSFAKQLLKSLTSIVKNPKGKRLLDIGCGGGFAVEYATSLGYAAEGIESNEELVRWCQKRGLTVSKLDVMQMEIPLDQKFDVIILSAILEHLKDPFSLLLHIRKKMVSHNGVILISQASYDGLLPRIFPWGWYGWQPQEHFWHFTPDSFTMLANRAGFDVIYLKRNSLYHPWFINKNIEDLVGRNLAAVIARVGLFLGMGDSFHAVIQPVNTTITEV